MPPAQSSLHKTHPTNANLSIDSIWSSGKTDADFSKLKMTCKVSKQASDDLLKSCIAGSLDR